MQVQLKNSLCLTQCAIDTHTHISCKLSHLKAETERNPCLGALCPRKLVPRNTEICKNTGGGQEYSYWQEYWSGQEYWGWQASLIGRRQSLCQGWHTISSTPLFVPLIATFICCKHFLNIQKKLQFKLLIQFERQLAIFFWVSSVSKWRSITCSYRDVSMSTLMKRK